MPETTVQLPLRRVARRGLRAAGAALAAFLLVTCSSDSPVGPGRRGIGSVRVAPAFDAFARVAPLTLDGVRVIVVRPPAETLAVVPKPFNPNSNQLQLNIPVFLQSVTEDLLVTLELYSRQTLLFSGTRTLRVSQGAATPPDSIPVVYQGPGSQVTTLVISPRDTTVKFGAILPYVVSATDAQQAPVAQYYVSWSTPGAPAGTTIDATGKLTAPSKRDTFYVKVVTPNGVIDSTSVIIAAAPASLVKSSGDGQTAPIGTRLALPLAVQVNGTDGLPVPGTAVTFAAATGGGSVDSATATTDAQGIARSGATLGATVGPQTFTASATGLTAVTFNATGIGASGTVTWTGATSSTWTVAGNWNPALVPDSTSDVVIPSGTPNQPSVTTAATCFARTLTVNAGATLGVGAFDCQVKGNVFADGSITGAGSLLITTTAQLRGNISNLLVSGPVTLAGNTLAAGNVTSLAGGDLIIGGHTLQISGSLVTQQTGLFTMTNALDSVVVLSAASFAGGDETAQLTAGYLKLAGSLGQLGGTSGASFAASGSHRTEMAAGALLVINFATPGAGAGTSHFNDLIINGASGGIGISNNTFVNGQLISHPTGATPVIGVTAGGPKVLTATGVDVSALGIDQNVMTIGAGTITQFDNVAFTGQANAVTQLTISNPGTSAALTFNGLSFAVAPTTGLYLAATDLDGATPNALTINVNGASPAAPSPSLFSASNGAVINWPGSTPPKTWNGSVSVNWNDPANWTPTGVPSGADDVTIPSGTPFSAQSSSGNTAKTLTVNAGAVLTLNAILQVGGNVFADGAITGPGVVAIIAPAQVRGTISNLEIDASTQLVGGLTLTTDLAAKFAGGALTLGGHTITVGGSLFTSSQGTIVMTNPADLLSVGGNISFAGGDETGLLTAGTIQVAGNFSQTVSTFAFVASGTHTVVFTGAGPHTLAFSDPGPSASHFQNLDVSQATGGITLSGASVSGQLISTPGAGTPVISASVLTSFIVAGVNVTRLQLDRVLLQIGGLVNGPVTAFDNVSFINMDPTTAQLAVNHPGAPTPLTFNNLSFAVTPTTGVYLAANDRDGPTPDALTINMVGATPASPSGFLTATNGAVVIWPGSAPPITWTGATNTDWNTASNWSPAQIPTALNSVVIPVTANTPLVNFNGDSVLDLTVNSGAILQIGSGGLTLTAMGNVNATGRIDAIGTGSGILQLAGSGKTLSGTFGQGATFGAVLSVHGSYTLAGRTTSTNAAEIIGPAAHLTLGGHTLVVGGAFNVGVGVNQGLLTMTNPLDSLLLASTSPVQFVGSDETGQLTAGVLEIRGNFTQGGPNATSFVATGTHKTVLLGGQTVGWSNPGTSHFQDVDVSGAATFGTVNFGASTIATGQLISLPSATAPTINGTLTAAGANVTGFQSLGFVILNGGTITAFDNVSFPLTPASGAALTVQNTGAGGPFTFNNLSFANSPGGFYISANDLDGAASGVLTINMVNPTPANPGAFVQQLGGAQVFWPAPYIWTGAVSTDWSNPGNWSANLVPTSANDVVIPATTNKPAITSTCAAKSILVNSGGQLNLGTLNCQVSGNVTSSGTIIGSTGAIQIVAPGQIQGNFPNLIASAPVTVTGATGLGGGNGNVTITGVGASLSLNGQTLVAPGNLSVQGGGILVMTNPADVLTVQGSAVFDGGNESGALTAGRLSVFGNFSQAATSSTGSFFAGGNHLTVLGGPSSAVAFATSGISRFQDLDVSSKTGTLTLGSNVTIAGQLISNTGGSNGPTITGSGFTLTAGGADILAGASSTALTMDGVPLVLSGGTITSFSNVTFNNQSPIGIALTVNNAGTAAPFTFASLNFTTSLTAGGFHIQANDLDGASPNALVIDVIGSNPATGGGLFQANNGAIINWPPVGSLVWTGAVSNDWSNPGNWDLGRVPTIVDDAAIGIGTPNQPKMSVSTGINNLTIQGGAVVDLDTTILVVGGNLDNSGNIVGVTGTAGMTIVGVGRTMKGSIGVDAVVSGSYTLNGPVSAFSLAVSGGSGNGSLVLNGNQVAVTNGFSTVNTGTVTMNNPADQLTVGGQALFAGGDETGKLTDGLLQLGGDFAQIALSSTTSFAPSGKHVTKLNSATTQTINFGSPGLGTGGSHFQVLDLSGATGGATLTVNSIADSVIAANAAAKLSSSGSSLTMRRAQISGLTADNTTLILDEQGVFQVENMSGITFQGFGTTGVTMMKIAGPGGTVAARPAFTTDNVNFQSLPIGAGNLYVDLTSTNGGFFTLTMTGSNQSPQVGGNGPTNSNPANQVRVSGALVSWP